MDHSLEVLARVRRPERIGALPADAADVGTGQAGTLDEGTVTRVQVQVEAGRVAQAVFKVFGCSAAIASASLVAERLDGAGVETAATLTGDAVAASLGIGPARRHVAALAVEAAQAAIRDWEQKQR